MLAFFPKFNDLKCLTTSSTEYLRYVTFLNAFLNIIIDVFHCRKINNMYFNFYLNSITRRQVEISKVL
jgi:hypothetical protein